MNIKDIKIGLEIWVMKYNKPVKMTVSKVITTDEIDVDNTPIQKIIAYATYSKFEYNEHTIIPEETFLNIEELKGWLFDFKY